jgi:hypothetical protein
MVTPQPTGWSMFRWLSTRNAKRCLAAAVAATLGSAVPGEAFGNGVSTGQPLEEIVVTVRRIGLIGESQAASEGIVTSVQVEGRPTLRPGEVLETVPGLIVTQHSGVGKANRHSGKLELHRPRRAITVRTLGALPIRAGGRYR